MKIFIDKIFNDKDLDLKTKHSLLIDLKEVVNNIIYNKINHRTMLKEYNELIIYIDEKIKQNNNSR